MNNPLLGKRLGSLLAPITKDFDIHQDINSLSTEHSHLCYIANGIVDGREVSGLPTVLTIDNNGNYCNAFSYLSDSAKENGGNSNYQSLEKYNGEAILIGDLTSLHNEPLQVCIGVREALALYVETSKPVICLPSFKLVYYKQMINHFGEKYTLKIFDLLTDKKQRVHALSDCEFNGTLYLTILPLFDICTSDIDFQATISDSTQTSITLFNGKVSQWGDIGSLSSGDKVKQEYPIQYFDGNLRAVIEKIAYYTETELPMAGQSVLGALSTLAQKYVNAPLGYSYVPASLFLLTEGISGGGKTLVHGLAYKSIIETDKEKYREYIEECKIKREAGEPKPCNPVMLMGDVTIERLVDRAIHEGVKDLSLVSDEGGNFFGGHSMKANTALNSLSNLTKLYSGSPISRFRSIRGENKSEFQTSAYDCRLTLDLQAQPVVIDEVMKDEQLLQQGLMPRMLFASEASKIGRRTFNVGNPHRDKDLNAYWERCRDIALENHVIPFDQKELYDQDGNIIRYNMPFASNIAREHLNEYRRKLEQRLSKGGKYLQYSSFVSRLAENATRIATILAFYNRDNKIDVRHLDCGIALAEFSINEVISYGGNIFTESKASKLLSVIHRNTSPQDNSILYSKIQNKVRLRKDELVSTLQELVDNNLIQILKRDNKQFIVVNPKSYPDNAQKQVTIEATIKGEVYGNGKSKFVKEFKSSFSLSDNNKVILCYQEIAYSSSIEKAKTLLATKNDGFKDRAREQFAVWVEDYNKKVA